MIGRMRLLLFLGGLCLTFVGGVQRGTIRLDVWNVQRERVEAEYLKVLDAQLWVVSRVNKDFVVLLSRRGEDVARDVAEVNGFRESMAGVQRALNLVGAPERWQGVHRKLLEYARLRADVFNELLRSYELGDRVGREGALDRVGDLIRASDEMGKLVAAEAEGLK